MIFDLDYKVLTYMAKPGLTIQSCGRSSSGSHDLTFHMRWTGSSCDPGGARLPLAIDEKIAAWTTGNRARVVYMVFIDFCFDQSN